MTSGVKRSPEEMEDGKIDLSGDFGPYNINALRYSEENFDKLVELSQYNIMNNKDMIFKALRLAVERKKQSKNNLQCRTEEASQSGRKGSKI